jgi:hypothetical protein
MFFLLTLPALAGTSASYRLTTEIIDSGGQTGSSAAYRLLGKGRERGTGRVESAAYLIGEGFLRSVYYGPVIFAPIVTAIAPDSGSAESVVQITALTGANFQTGATVKLSLSGQTDISAESVVVVNSGKITCTFNLAGAAVGLWSVTVTNPDGRSGTLPSAFRIGYAAPQVSAIRPNRGTNDAAIDITALSGKYFRSGAKVWLTKTGESDIAATNVVVVSSDLITCRFDLTNKTAGRWSVVVENEDGQRGTLAEGFGVETPAVSVVGPVTASVNPFDPGVSATAIRYNLSKDAEITIYVYNIRGVRIWQKTFPVGAAGGSVGANEVEWRGISEFKEIAPQGVYFVRVTTTANGELKTIGQMKIMVRKQR